MQTLRKIINIDQEKCDGCGICINSCAEGALALVDGKARLVKEKYCDGLAACLKECPRGALTITEREAEEFDPEATQEHLHQIKKGPENCEYSCPGISLLQFKPAEDSKSHESNVRQASQLANWPVQLALVPPGAPFLNNADVVLVADCVPVAYPDLHTDFIKGHAVLLACPKLDDFQSHLSKLQAILKQSRIKSLTVVHMEVPCCSGLTFMAQQALAASDKDIPFKDITIGIKGDIKVTKNPVA